MQKVCRFHPPNREVLTNITLAFYPGAKIGVLGSNGSGKSTLLQIMAGIDNDYSGEASISEGFTSGLLEQEPILDEESDVTTTVLEGVGEIAHLLSRYEELLTEWSDPKADFEMLGNKLKRD